MSDQTILENTRNAISSPESVSGPTPCAVPDGLTMRESGQEVARANLSARQAKEMGLLTSGTYGQRGTISSLSASLQLSLASRLQARTASVGSDMEASGYAFGAIDLCAAGVGAPHIRQRLWFVGQKQLDNAAGEGFPVGAGKTLSGRQTCLIDQRSSDVDGLADTAGYRQLRQGTGGAFEERRQPRSIETRQLPDGLEGHSATLGLDHHHHHQGPQRYAWDGCAAERRQRSERSVTATGLLDRLADTDINRCDQGRECQPPTRSDGFIRNTGFGQGQPATGPTNSHWRDADWLFCRDGKWRPVEPGSFPLAHGATSRVGRLRAYGNAIVAQAAETFIRSFTDVRGGFDLV